MKDRRQKTIALVAMIVAVVGLSVGFAAFSNNLLIKSRVSVNPDSSKFGVVFSTSSTSEVTNAVIPTKNPTSITATNGTIDNSTTPTISNLSATFTSPGQSATYSFYAYNKGEYLAYLNSITFLGSKTCTAGTGTTQTLVDEACNNISVTVQIGSISTSATKTDITGETIAAGNGKTVTVTLKYEGTARADGPFEVEFGDISMYFASVTGINEGTEGSGGSGDVETSGGYGDSEEGGTLYTGEIYRNSKREEVSIGDSIDNITYETDLANISTNVYLKHEVVNNEVTASYACIKYTESGTRKDACVRGGDPSYYASNQEILRSIEQFCINQTGSCNFDGSNSSCNSTYFTLNAYSDGRVIALDGDMDCNVDSSGNSTCP